MTKHKYGNQLKERELPRGRWFLMHMMTSSDWNINLINYVYLLLVTVVSVSKKYYSRNSTVHVFLWYFDVH